MLSDPSLTDLFHRVVQAPTSLLEQPVAVQSRLIRMLRRHLLLGSVALRIDDQALAAAPAKLRDQLDAALVHVAVYRRQLRWEVRQITHALAALEVPVVLLKGAAYDFLELPNARGRWVSDVDILVPRARLPEVEQALIAHGWRAMKLDEYDQGYYRQWMHELPPLSHAERGTIVDVHHAILPVTSRLRADSARLLEASVALEQPPLRVLAPADMVLHAAVHLFHDGDLANGLRELYDLDALFGYFGAREGFWDELIARATELGLERPLYHALTQRHRRLGIAPPARSAALLRRHAGLGSRLVGRMMAWQLEPVSDDGGGWRRALAGQFLYVRSHWLRMPPLMLARHLLTKARMRREAARDARRQHPADAREG